MKNLVTGSKRSSLIRSLRKSAQTNGGKFHVLPTKGRWGVKREGSDRFYRVVASKIEAVSIARRMAFAKGSHIVVVHNKDGHISDLKSYAKRL